MIKRISWSSLYLLFSAFSSAAQVKPVKRCWKILGQWQHNLKKFTYKKVKTKQNKTRASMIYKGGKAGNCAKIVSSSL